MPGAAGARVGRVLLHALAVCVLLVVVTAGSVHAQAPARGVRIGVLSPGSPEGAVPVLVDALRDAGWIEGRNTEILRRWARGDHAALAALASELVELKVDVIVTYDTEGALAAKDATTTVPIVMAVSTDAVRAGLIASLARPGGNVTGNSIPTPYLSTKRLELLRELLPRARRVALIVNPSSPAATAMRSEEERAAERVGLEMVTAELSAPAELQALFERLGSLRAEALLLLSDPVIVATRGRIIDRATRRRLPIAADNREFVEAGALLSYAPSPGALARRAAITVDRILRGAPPAELPVQQPVAFELVVNRRTARTLGLTVPAAILLRADAVID